MKYDAVFFDLDGTVVDSLQDIADAVNHTMRFIKKKVEIFTELFCSI